MQIEVVKSKIHRVHVTGAELDYIGSITLDTELMDAAGILPGERVYIVNINNAYDITNFKFFIYNCHK